LKLVIIAAGRGSRISSISNGLPKILIEVFNKTLLEHLIQNCVSVGISDIVIVTGHNSDIIHDYISDNRFNINIELAYNDDWNLPNGISVLASKNNIPKDHDFMISMSDHFYNDDLLIKIKDSVLTNITVNVGADYKTDAIHDPDDAMKLIIDRNSNIVSQMSKGLLKFNAVDCGIFKCKYEFFSILQEAKDIGKYSLSDACNILINNQDLGGVNIEDSMWIDIDTPEALDYINKNRKLFE
jgi:choline kinase